MAKKEKTNETLMDEMILEAMPGGDPIKKEDTQFDVDLNFEPVEEVEEEESDNEEVTEETDAPAEEEVAEKEPETPEEEEAPAEPEAVSEEGMDENSEADAQPDIQPIEGSDENVSQEVEQPKAPMVPKSRLDEVLAKQKALQKQLDEAKAAQEQALENAPEYDFGAKEAEYQQLVLDGEAEKAVNLRNEIRNAEKEQFMFEVQAKMGQTVQKNQEMTELQAKAAEIEATFSVLNENSADFDVELQNEVVELRNAFMSQGYTPADSLTKATEYTLAAKKPELLNPTPVSQTPKVDEQVAEKKKVANINKKLQAADSQPPSMKGESAKGDKKIDLHKLSDDEFSALPEETLRRMRGDFGL
jgi:hypothetical protein